jgi:Galactose oxidase, central domain
MKKSLLLLLSVCSLCLLNACGGSGGSTPPVLTATHFSVTAPATATAGTAFNFTVSALDASNNVVTTYSGIVQFTSIDAQALLPGISKLMNGSGTFSATLNTAGNQTITATDTATASIAGTSNSIKVTALPATHLSVTAPANATVGTAFNFTVTALDASNNVVTGYTGTVHFTSIDAQAVLPGNSTLMQGMGTFSATLKTSGSETITATDTASSSITGTSSPISVSGPATHFSFANASNAAGTRSPITLLVVALDASNNQSSGYTGTVQITTSDAKAMLPANGPLQGGAGNFQLTFETAGNQTVTATDTTTHSITGTSGTIVVTATAAPAITSGPPPNGTVGTGYNPHTARVCLQFRDDPFPVCVRFGFKQVFFFPFSATGGVGALTWSWAPVAPSSLPPGLNLAAENEIAGTPTAAGTYQVSVTVTDSGSPPAQTTMNYTIVIMNPPPPAVSTAPALLPGATVNQPFGFTFTATAGLPPYQNWSETGALPPGLAFSTEGVLSGIATMTGSFPITVTVDDSLGQMSAAQAFTVQVFPHGFKPDGSMGMARTGHTATLLPDGTVLLAGGLALASAEKYDPGTAEFTPTTGSMSVARSGHTATLLTTGPNSGQVLITGGQARGVGSAPFATAELFDPGTGTFTLTKGNMSVARAGHNATLLSDGKVLITGGGVLTADLFDPSTGLFTPTTGPLVAARNNDTATLLPTGQVLITGGFNGAALATAELYDPTTKTFSATGPMAVPRASQTATLLTTGADSGKVLVAGGNNLDSVAAELYDPTMGTFSATGFMVTARSGHTATLLSDGTVLMAGGSDASGDFLAAAELFDPNSGTFSRTGGLQTARQAHTATLLKDGTVLVTGGVNQSGILATAELYQ